jgi:hypothetical protein
MFEIREYDSGGYSVCFDVDFEFNVFRHYMEKRYEDIEVCLLKMDDNFGIICNRLSLEQPRLDEFTVNKIRRDTKQEFGFALEVEENGIIQMQNYLDFVGELIIVVFTNNYKQAVDFDEEEIVDDDGELKIQTIAYIDEIPDYVFEVMDQYYEF